MKRRFLFLPFLFVTIGLLAVPPKKNGGKVDYYDYNNDYSTEYTTDTDDTDDADDTDKTDTVKGISRWSVALEAGLNRFNGGVSNRSKYALGGVVEYNIAPAWSVGMNYHYMPLKATYEDGALITNLASNVHSVDLFNSVNLLRTFLPKSTSKWGVWAQIGLGHAWYRTKYTADSQNEVNNSQGTHTNFNDTVLNGNATYYPVGLLVEYNFNESLALGLRGQIRAFNTDYIERIMAKGITNDRVSFATLQLRWKFNAKSDEHYRNYIQEETVIVQQPEIEIPDYTPRLDDLERRVKRMEDILCPDGPDDDNDGVPNCRDQEKETPKGKQVDFWGRTIEVAKKTEMKNENAFIYFGFDKTGLDYEANKAIANCAKKMTADPELIVEVRGYTDNVGNVKYNARLSQKRADVVKSELVKKYGISADRIIANGKGKYNPGDKTMPFRSYRTCVLFYSK